MKIAIDYHLVSRNPKSGMGVYINEIVKYLKRVDTKNSYLLFDNNFPAQTLVTKIAALLKEQLWIQFTLPQEFKNKKIGLAYFPNPPLPIFSDIPLVLTIPDLSFFKDPSFSLIVKIYLYCVYFISAHKAKVITTFSECSKNDISNILLISKKKVEIAFPGVKPIFVDKLPKTQTLKLGKFGINKPYFLSVPGTFIPRKNMMDLADAYFGLKGEIKSKFQLVMVGNMKDSYFISFKSLIDEKYPNGNIIYLSQISDEDLRVLYQGATLFAFPSLYEGFGLPPLEAMACKTPVVVYNNSSLPEVVGDGALMVNNKSELGKAMTELTNNSHLRETLVNNGLKRVKLYTCNKSGDAMAKILNKTSL